jgi:hypothetical protein
MEAELEVAAVMSDKESMSWLLNKIDSLYVINDLEKQ